MTPAAAEESGMAISAAPPVMAEVLEAEPEDATAALRKRSRVHEVYSADPNDDNYSLCHVPVPGECPGRPCLRWPHQEPWQHEVPMESRAEEASVLIRQVEQSR